MPKQLRVRLLTGFIIATASGSGQEFTAPSTPEPFRGRNGAIFIQEDPENNGLPNLDDEGVGGVTGRGRDSGTFKSPTLRNIALTAPYMHDGRFDTLMDVVNHYNDGMVNHRNLDGTLRNRGGARRLGLDAGERAALVAFLETLTDPAIASEPRWSDPFQESSTPSLPATQYRYEPDLPAHFQTDEVRRMDNTPRDNPITDAGATLGRVLFYDEILSRNRTISCASCHQQERGFSDPEPLSTGFAGGRTGRNSMPLIELRYYDRGRMFWDERAGTLEDQVLMPIQDRVEMGLTLAELVDRIAGESYYPPLFEAAFGDSEVTSQRISRSLAQFVRSIVATNSKWDRAVAEVNSINGDLPGLSAQENLGKRIFFGQNERGTLCANCHLPDNPLEGRGRGRGRRGRGR